MHSNPLPLPSNILLHPSPIFSLTMRGKKQYHKSHSSFENTNVMHAVLLTSYCIMSISAHERRGCRRALTEACWKEERAV